MRKKIVMFYGKERVFKDNPFENSGIKKTVYLYFFEQGTILGYDMYLVFGIKNYLGNLAFSNPLFFNGTSFEKTTGEIKSDAVFDRSGGLAFPPLNIKEKVLNNRIFKKLCWDKALMYNYLEGYCSMSFSVRNYSELKSKLQNFDNKKFVVLKPARGLKGKGVVIDYPQKIASLRDIDFSDHWVLQEFINTSSGIAGLVSGAHDLRVAIVNGKIVFSHIRQPKSDSYIANVANGGSIKEIDVEKIPQEILMLAKKIQKKIDADFDKPLYSIDFGMQDKKAFVFEINDTIGFPSEKMHYKKFIDETLNALIVRTVR